MRKKRSHVLGMILEEFDAEKYERTIRAEGRQEEREESIRYIVELLQEVGQTKMFVTDKIAEKYVLSHTEAEEITNQYWKQR